MNDIEFYRTAIGRRYYGSTLPDLVRELARFNTTFERYVALLHAQGSGPASSDAPGAASAPSAAPKGSP